MAIFQKGYGIAVYGSVTGHSHSIEAKKFDLNCKTWNSNFEWTLTEDDFCIAWYNCNFYFQATTLTQNYNVRVIMSVWHPLMLQRIGKHHSCAQMEQFLIKNYSHVIGGKPWTYSYKIEKNHVYLVPNMFNFVLTKKKWKKWTFFFPSFCRFHITLGYNETFFWHEAICYFQADHRYTCCLSKKSWPI